MTPSPATDCRRAHVHRPRRPRTLTAPGRSSRWRSCDIRGVPTRAWKNAPPTSAPSSSCPLGHGDADFLVYEDERTTFAEHFRIAAALAHQLRRPLRGRAGDRVAIAMRNLPEWAMAFWAATPPAPWWCPSTPGGPAPSCLRPGRLGDQGRLRRRGAPRAHPARTSADLARPPGRGRDRRGPHRPATAPPSVDPADRRRAPVPEWPFAAALGAPVDEAVTLPDVAIDPEDDATIFYTSGTTGGPRGGRHPPQHAAPT